MPKSKASTIQQCKCQRTITLWSSLWLCVLSLFAIIKPTHLLVQTCTCTNKQAGNATTKSKQPNCCRQCCVFAWHPSTQPPCQPYWYFFVASLLSRCALSAILYSILCAANFALFLFLALHSVCSIIKICYSGFLNVSSQKIACQNYIPQHNCFLCRYPCLFDIYLPLSRRKITENENFV